LGPLLMARQPGRVVAQGSCSVVCIWCGVALPRVAHLTPQKLRGVA